MARPELAPRSPRPPLAARGGHPRGRVLTGLVASAFLAAAASTPLLVPRPAAGADPDARETLRADGATDAEELRSEAHLRAHLLRVPGEPSRLVLRIQLDPGWHVNANPASLPSLVATAVEAPDPQVRFEARYPAGESFWPEFAAEPIQVYSGHLEIGLLLPAGAPEPERLALRFQACDARVCLPPGRLELRPQDSLR